MIPPRARVVALGVVMALALTACTATAGMDVAPRADITAAPVPSAEYAEDQGPAAVAALRALPFSEASVESFVRILERSGVEVVEGFDSRAAAPVHLTRWQAENMAAEVANGGGVTGRTLAELAPTPPRTPPLPFLIAAWILEGRTPGADFARAIYEDQDLGDAYSLRFPDAVLALFLADATRAEPPSSPGSSPVNAQTASVGGSVRVTSAVLMADPIDAPCSAVSGFVQRAIDAVATALTITTTGGGFFGFLAAIWNTAVALASKFVGGLIKALTAPIVAQLVGVFNAIAAVEQISSVLIAWRAPLNPTPTSNRLGVGDELVTGEVVLQLQPHVLPVPPAVTDCAQSVGVDITATAAGSSVTWLATPQPIPALATTLTSGKALDTRESSTLRYQTGQEPADSLEGKEQVGTLTVSTTIRRNDVERVRQLIAQLLLSQVPISLRSIVESLARPILDAATGKLAEITDVHSQTQVPITYHAEPPCKTSRIAPGTYQGAFDTDIRNGAARGHASGSVAIDVSADQTLTGILNVDTKVSGGGLTMRSTERLRISGTTGKPVVTLEERTIDGKDATFPQEGTTRPMVGLCPPGLLWDIAPLSPGTHTSTSKGIVVTARRVN